MDARCVEAGSPRLVEGAAGARSPRSLPRRAALALVTLALVTLALAARADAFIYWSSVGTNTIGRANLDGTNANQGFITGLNFPEGVAVDAAHVYWANNATNTIGQANINGTGVNDDFITGTENPTGVAVDGAYVYWSNFSTATIGRANLNGTGVDQSFITGISGRPQGVAVDGAHVYWTNFDTDAIGIANINGTGIDNDFITLAANSGPNGVAVDDAHVYWTSLNPNTIGQANLDGSGVDQSFVTGAHFPTGVASDGANVYWTNGSASANTIGRANPDGSGVDQSFISGVNEPYGLAVDALLGTPPPAQPKCGDTITTDTTLRKDLVNCPNNGIIIGADGITLDLNYHTIDGDGRLTHGCPETEFCDVGVANFGHDGVTVVHGSLRQFGGGVDFGEVRHNRLLDISASRNHSVGIQVFSCSRSLIRDSSATDSTSPDAGTGLGVFGCHHVRVINNSVRRNAGHHGMVLVDSNHSLIKGNRVSRNGGEGVILEGGKHNRIKRNRLARNDAGITLGPGSHNVITRNHVSRGRDGIRIEKGHGNLVANNVVSRARRAGIRLGISNPFLGGAHNVVRGNLVKDSRVDGYLVNAKDDHSLLRHNTARRAGDDGFDVESRSAKLTRNRALRNGDLGIHAVRGVNGGGGNVARHNGDPRQCTHIVCR